MNFDLIMQLCFSLLKVFHCGQACWEQLLRNEMPRAAITSLLVLKTNNFSFALCYLRRIVKRACITCKYDLEAYLLCFSDNGMLVSLLLMFFIIYTSQQDITLTWYLDTSNSLYGLLRMRKRKSVSSCSGCPLARISKSSL